MQRKYEFQKTEIPGLMLVHPFYTDDTRGRFVKAFSKEIFEEHGCAYDVAEELILKNRPGVMRGLHFQRVEQPVKIVHCISGHVWDVVVDLRPDSPSFKKWLGFDLSEEENTGLLIPGGCATGFLALETSIVTCKCSEKFNAEYDDGICWDDPEIGVAWPLEAVGGLESIILSARDKSLQTFREFIESCGGL